MSEGPIPVYPRILKTYGSVASIAVIANLLIISNPGFQSHDEWQIYDFVRKYGLRLFIDAYVRVYAGPEFGWPVRPLGFLQEGLLSYWTQSAPVVLHGFSVLVQTLTAIVFVRVLTGAGLNRYRAVTCGILFGISPLATFATGWTAACFDQWYSLFALLAAWSVVAIANKGLSAARLAALAIASGLAILSKETATMLPAAAGALVVAISLLRGSKVPWRMVVLVGIISAVPVLCYLSIRLPAILGTLHGTVGPYSPSARNAPGNAVMYFAYPASILMGEIPPMTLAGIGPLVTALAMHVILVSAVLFRFGWLAVCAYVAAYFVFLLPVLTLPSPGVHYLYACAFATSLALGCLLVDRDGCFRPHPTALIALACVVLFSVHSVNIQRELYRNGRCQHDFLLSLDLRMGDTAAPIVIRADPGVAWWNGLRAITGRDMYSRVTLTDRVDRPATYRMDWSCRVLPIPNP